MGATTSGLATDAKDTEVFSKPPITPASRTPSPSVSRADPARLQQRSPSRLEQGGALAGLEAELRRQALQANRARPANLLPGHEPEEGRAINGRLPPSTEEPSSRKAEAAERTRPASVFVRRKGEVGKAPELHSLAPNSPAEHRQASTAAEPHVSNPQEQQPVHKSAKQLQDRDRLDMLAQRAAAQTNFDVKRRASDQQLKLPAAEHAHHSRLKDQVGLPAGNRVPAMTTRPAKTD